MGKDNILTEYSLCYNDKKSRTRKFRFGFNIETINDDYSKIQLGSALAAL